MHGPTLEFKDPRAVLKRYGLHPKRSWGQCFLVSPKAVKIIADACVGGDSSGIVVAEIGAGVGTLTSALIQRGAVVTAVERDREMCDILRAEIGEEAGFTLIEADAAKVDYAELFGGKPGVIAGNLPYQLTGRLIRRVVAAVDAIERAVLMVQREVAERLAAPAGHPARGALSVVVEARFHARIIHRLKPTAFHPPPKVHSAVVRLDPRDRKVFDRGIDPDAFDAMVNAAFSGRRKTLLNALVAAGIADRETVRARIAQAGIDPGLRPERLSVDDFARLTDPRK